MTKAEQLAEECVKSYGALAPVYPIYLRGYAEGLKEGRAEARELVRELEYHKTQCEPCKERLAYYRKRLEG